jgi:hypothetical protein
MTPRRPASVPADEPESVSPGQAGISGLRRGSGSPSGSRGTSTLRVSPGRAAAVEAAARSWSRQLVDLGGRNSLIYYRGQRSGTLDLGALPRPAIEALVRGERIDVMSFFAGSEIRADVLRRLRRIHSKSREYFEEQGVSTLYLAVGLATWTSDRTPNVPNAPALLRPAVLSVRGAAQSDFKLGLDGDMEISPTLLHVLEAEFGRPLDLGDLESRIDGPIDTTAEIEAVLEAVRSAAAHVPGFTVRGAFTLANFSYAKLPMVKDLEAAGAALAGHDVIAALAGHSESSHRIQDRNRAIAVPLGSPDNVAPGEEALVLDADASQSFVVDSAMAGGDLIVKGPPGTGKSQTIANLIATAAARGKTVLFVAEKRAAIDAVLNRLRDHGLGDLVLDMHGLSTRRAVAETMARSLDLVGAVPADPPDPDLATLRQVRAALAGHVRTIHEPRQPWGVSVWEARLRCHFAASGARTDLRLERQVLDRLAGDRYVAAQRATRGLAELDAFEERVADSPWQRLDDGDPDAFPRALEVVARLRGGSLGAAFDRVAAETADTGLPLPGSIAGWKACVEAWTDVARAVDVFGPGIFGPDPGCVAGVRVLGATFLGATSDAVSERQSDLRSEWQAQFPSLFRDPTRPAVVRPEMLAAFEAFDPDLRGFARLRARLFDRRYRAARDLIRPMLAAPWTSDEEAADALAGAVRAARFWDRLAGDGLPRMPASFTSQGGPSFESVYGDLAALRPVLDALAARSSRSTGASGASPGGFEDLSIEALGKGLDRLAREKGIALRLPRIRERLGELQAVGLGPCIEEMASERLGAGLLGQRLDFVWHRSILDRLELEEIGLTSFDPVRQSRAVADFARLDTHAIAGNPGRITRAYAERVVGTLDRYRDQAQVIVHQAALKRGHMPLRRLFAAAPDVLLALKPCWAMSPLMVSQWLPPDTFFDLVVFDEASQVLPADAVPAILRGRQLVVAGDNRQLPPTTFFASQSLDDDVDEEALLRETQPTEGFESVLDSVSPILPTATLTWHYRSRDESLIAFSNRSFYDGALTTFPSPSGEPAIRHVLVRPGTARGEGGADDESARDEVAEVVRLVVEAAEKRPGESLGVIALGIAQAERIQDAIHAAVKNRRDLDAFFDDQVREPFFVKNLERVQGDEREAIILSIGYAKTADGRLLRRFGPINLEGGERRLNVAVTRSRRRMIVVSAFTAADIDLRKGLSVGAQRLRDYLAYAESASRSEMPATPADGELSPLERELRDGLAAAGVATVPRVGKSGQAIDFGVVHPTDPNRFVMALELDGPAYARIPTTRDRDRLREQQLERLGWGYHRLWVDGWLSDRDGAIETAKRAVEAVLDGRKTAVSTGEPGKPKASHTAEPDPPDPGEPAVRGPRPDVPRYKSLRTYKPEQLVALVDWIESDGVDRSEREVIDLALEDVGGKALTVSAQKTLSLAVHLSRRTRHGGHYKAYPRPPVPRHPTTRDLVPLVDWIESDTLLRTEQQLAFELCREAGWRFYANGNNSNLLRFLRETRRTRASRAAKAPPKSRH